MSKPISIRYCRGGFNIRIDAEHLAALYGAVQAQEAISFLSVVPKDVRKRRQAIKHAFEIFIQKCKSEAGHQFFPPSVSSVKSVVEVPHA